MDKQDIVKVILGSLQDIIEEHDLAEEIPENGINADTFLLGRRSFVDSLNLVSMIVDVEQKLNAQHGIGITIADERAMSREKSPFRTVETLAEYIEELIHELDARG